MTVDHVTKLEKWSARAWSAALAGSSLGKNEDVSNRLDSRLKVVAIGAIIFYALCILEFTIGIKNKRRHYRYGRFAQEVEESRRIARTTTL